jgi:glutamine amidotransferase PdxT
MNKRELVIKQIDLMDDIRQKADINIVTCGNCGTLVLHKRNAEEIECFGCMNVMDVSDCPDYWYNGVENNAEFND